MLSFSYSKCWIRLYSGREAAVKLRENMDIALVLSAVLILRMFSVMTKGHSQYLFCRFPNSLSLAVSTCHLSSYFTRVFRWWWFILSSETWHPRSCGVCFRCVLIRHWPQVWERCLDCWVIPNLPSPLLQRPVRVRESDCSNETT